MKMWLTLTATLVFVTACGQETRKETPERPVLETTPTSASTPPAQTPAPTTPTAPTPTPPTPPPAPTTPAPTTSSLDCSDMQALLQEIMTNGGDPQQILQQCMGSLGGGGGLPNIPGLPTGGNTP